MAKDMEKREVSHVVVPNIHTDTDTRFKYDHEEIKATFHFDEASGQVLSFPFHKYKEDDVTHWSFSDGVTYTIPRMIFDHVNSLKYPIYRDFSTKANPKDPYEERRQEVVGYQNRCHMSQVGKYDIGMVEDKEFRGQSWMNKKTVDNLEKKYAK